MVDTDSTLLRAYPLLSNFDRMSSSDDVLDNSSDDCMADIDAC